MQSKSSLPISLVLGILFLLLFPSLGEGKTKYIILFIGDGMGPEHVKAASFYVGGQEGTLSFEQFPFQTQMTTHSADNSITDSAASATAMATGVKVNNGVIAQAIPGSGGDLKTLLEIYRDRGWNTGLVTTAYLTHATPAAFGAHQTNRSLVDQIGMDYLTQTQPTLLLGGGGNGLSPSSATQAGYTVVQNRDELNRLDLNQVTKVCGLFGSDHLPYEQDGLGNLPHLSEMTARALDFLSNLDGANFFLVVEGARIDHAGHNNDLPRNVLETVEFARAVQVAVQWAKIRESTLIVVTSDHETGGMNVTQNNGPGNFPTVTWSTTGHTGVPVNVYGWGAGAEGVVNIQDNTDIFAFLRDVDIPGGSGGGGCQLVGDRVRGRHWWGMIIPGIAFLLALGWFRMKVRRADVRG